MVKYQVDTAIPLYRLQNNTDTMIYVYRIPVLCELSLVVLCSWLRQSVVEYPDSVSDGLHCILQGKHHPRIPSHVFKLNNCSGTFSNFQDIDLSNWKPNNLFHRPPKPQQRWNWEVYELLRHRVRQIISLLISKVELRILSLIFSIDQLYQRYSFQK